MKRSTVLDLWSRVVFYPVLVGAVYLLFAGHNQPGGGFVGGLVAGAAIALRYVTGGLTEVRGLTRVKPWTVLGTGLLIASLTAAVPLFLGEPVLTSAVIHLDVPLLGTIETTTALFFDTGVFLLVVGLVLMTIEAFGEDTVEPAP